mmetsp:Transcript_28381/g.76892  ORF Transcript_28381/g.76892 Transcript_28381/m.76892 type:complete len:106 (+) Transcript_28381:346-663(+)
MVTRKKTSGLKKEDLLSALVAAEPNPPVGAVYWTAEDDAVLKAIEEEEITVAKTELSKRVSDDLRIVLNTAKAITDKRMEMAKEHMSPEEIKELEKARIVWPYDE